MFLIVKTLVYVFKLTRLRSIFRIDIYFERINPWACLLVRSDLAIDHGAHSPATPSSTSDRPRQPSVSLSHLAPGSGPHPRPPILIYAIVAITLRFSKHPHFAQSGPQSKESYHRLAKNRVILKTMEKMTAEGLKALALLALDSIEDGRGPGGWGGVLSLLTGGVSHGGLGEEEEIVRSAIEGQEKKGSIGKGKKGSEYVATTLKTTFISETTDWREVEERRRLFWCEFHSLSIAILLADHLVALSLNKSRSSSIDTHPFPPDGTLRSLLTMFDACCLQRMTIGNMDRFVFLSEDSSDLYAMLIHHLSGSRLPAICPADGGTSIGAPPLARLGASNDSFRTIRQDRSAAWVHSSVHPSTSRHPESQGYS